MEQNEDMSEMKVSIALMKKDIEIIKRDAELIRKYLETIPSIYATKSELEDFKSKLNTRDNKTWDLVKSVLPYVIMGFIFLFNFWVMYGRG